MQFKGIRRLNSRYSSTAVVDEKVLLFYGRKKQTHVSLQVRGCYIFVRS